MTAADKKPILRRMLIRGVVGTLLFAVLVFGPARSFNYWQAWSLMAVQSGAALYLAIYLFTRDPEVLRRRLLIKEESPWQQFLVWTWRFFSAASLVLAGLDHRFHWSYQFPVPVWLEILSLLLVLSGWVLYFRVLNTNRFGASVIRVESGQQVAMTGPYRLVRHPMYLAFLLMAVFSPLALGSMLAWVAGMCILPVIMLRLLHEEKLLRNDLAGYAEYCRKTRFRLVPFVW
jgi:protein-S-isoprenylcysteine O-methyltransferase Ste14